jgi:hypothetical protein
MAGATTFDWPVRQTRVLNRAKSASAASRKTRRRSPWANRTSNQSRTYSGNEGPLVYSAM